MGRTLHIKVVSATGLRNADAEEGGESDPFVVVCFDNKVSQELCRTTTASDTSDPEWNEEFDIDITAPIEQAIAETEEEPKMLTFCVYDRDGELDAETEPLGVSGVSFSDLVKSGKFEGELPVFLGEGSITVELALKKVKKSSMLKDNAALKIAGGVVGTAAVGALGYYLFNRYQKKKEKKQEAAEEEGEEVRTGMAYGADVDSDSDDEDDKGNMKRWWEMEDEDDDDEDDNRWGEDAN